MKKLLELQKAIEAVPYGTESVLVQKQIKVNQEIIKTFEEMHRRLDKVEEALNQQGCQCGDDPTRRTYRTKSCD